MQDNNTTPFSSPDVQDVEMIPAVGHVDYVIDESSALVDSEIHQDQAFKDTVLIADYTAEERHGAEEAAKQRTAMIQRGDVDIHIKATKEQVSANLKRVCKTQASLRKIRGLDTAPMMQDIDLYKKALMGLDNGLAKHLNLLDANKVYLEEALAHSNQTLNEYWRLTHATKPWMLDEHLSITAVKTILTTYYQCEEVAH